MNKETDTLKNLSERLNYALKFLGTKKADLARAIDVKPQVIQFLCNSQTQSSRFTFEIATALGLNTRWLATGEGPTFVADDSKQKFKQNYKQIPLLDIINLKNTYINRAPLNIESVSLWLPLITEDANIFCIQMIDNSMEPNFPIGSFLFIKECLNEKLAADKFIFSYLTKFDTFIVRELIDNGSDQILAPRNIDLFKEIKVTDETIFIGVVTACFWNIRN